MTGVYLADPLKCIQPVSSRKILVNVKTAADGGPAPEELLWEKA